MAASSDSRAENGDCVRNSAVNVEEMLVDTTPVASDKEDEIRIETNSHGTVNRTEEAAQLDALMQGINLEKLEHRAQRFGVEVTPCVKSVSESELKILYKSLDVDLKDVSKCGKIRLDTVHMRGVNEMNTDDVFDYFKGYGPATVEWVNDHSCNILWTDNASTARALVVLSQPIKRSPPRPASTTERTASDGAEIEEGEDVEMSDHDTSFHVRHCSSSSVESDVHQRSRQNSAEQANTLAPNNSPVDVGQSEGDSDAEMVAAIDASTIEIPVPPGPWRLGIPHPKAKSLLLRYAFKSDRKIVGAEKLSQYYIRYGNPNYQGLKGIISTSLKRKIKDVHHRPVGYVDLDAVNDDDNDNNDHVKDVDPIYGQDNLSNAKELPKRPRMRMYADDEEKKVKKSGVVSAQKSNLGRGDLRNRIGCEKFTFAASMTTTAGDQRSDGPDLRTRLSSTRRSASTDVGGGGAARDLSRPSVIGDLRSKLEKLRQSRQPKVPLFIEIAQDDI